MKEFFLQHQQKIATFTGYGLVFLLAFGLGKMTTSMPQAPTIRITEPIPLNNTAEVKGMQLNDPTPPAPETPAPSSPPAPAPAKPKAETKPKSTSSTKSQDGECNGKIKGNIGSSGLIYHMPGGSFYNRTKAEMCFDTEQQAQAAGFRRSKR